MDSTNELELKFRNLIQAFDSSLAREHIAHTVCLEVIRNKLNESMTFAQLNSRARNFAARLACDLKLNPQDRVAILGKNRCDWDVAFWATILNGAIPVLIDPERPPKAVQHHLIHTETSVIVMADDYRDPESRDRMHEYARTHRLAIVEMDGALGLDTPGSPPPQSPDPDPDDTAVILCTSGTTGDPREVELTHRNLITNIQGSLDAIHLSHDDILGHIIPAHHSFGLTVGKLLTLWVGATNIYTNKYRRISQLIQDRKVTVFAAIPSLYTVIARKLEDSLAEQKKHSRLLTILDRFAPKTVGRQIVKKQGWQSLRFMLSGAAPVPRWVLDVFWRRGIRLYQGYGTTENSPVYGFNEDARKLASVGPPIPTIFVRIIDEDCNPLPVGHSGEIALGGPCIMKGYLKNPQSTAAVVFTDDTGCRWLRTGDLGHLDEDGSLYITGRKKFMIVLPSGKNVSPELVEAALSEARFVAEILVLPGRRNDNSGLALETVRAVIHPDWDQLTAHTETSRDQLIKKDHFVRNIIWQSISDCQKHSTSLSPFERVASAQDIEIVVDGFEKTSTGKIKRQLYLST